MDDLIADWTMVPLMYEWFGLILPNIDHQNQLMDDFDDLYLTSILFPKQEDKSRLRSDVLKEYLLTNIVTPDHKQLTYFAQDASEFICVCTNIALTWRVDMSEVIFMEYKPDFENSLVYMDKCVCAAQKTLSDQGLLLWTVMNDGGNDGVLDCEDEKLLPVWTGFVTRSQDHAKIMKIMNEFGVQAQIGTVGSVPFLGTHGVYHENRSNQPINGAQFWTLQIFIVGIMVSCVLWAMFQY